MRYMFMFLAALVVCAGVVFGALNSQTISIDLWFITVELRSGVAMLLFSLLGALAAGACLWSTVIWPLRSRLKRVQRGIAGRASAAGGG